MHELRFLQGKTMLKCYLKYFYAIKKRKKLSMTIFITSASSLLINCFVQL
jgi:hypothetical protein